jgi:polysaccharide biosynthesis protein PslH
MPVPETFAELQSNPCYMVYVPRVRKRAEHSLKRLRDVGFDNVVLAEGVDGAREDPRVVGERRGFLFDPGLAAGQIGTTLSMIGLWEKVVDEGLPYMLVFEDDVLPHPDIRRLGPQYWAETPRAADFVFLGTQLVVEDLPDPDQRVVVSPSWCMHAYVITQEGARRALSLLREQLSCFDRWLATTDREVRHWMETGAIRYFCWNGTMLPPPYPSLEREGDGTNGAPDVVRSTRATGLFFQNLSLGSTIWPGRFTPGGSDGRHRPKVVLIVPMTPAQWGNGLAMRAGVTLDGLAMACDVTLVLVPLYSANATTEWVVEHAERLFVLPSAVADPFLAQLHRMASEEERHRARLIYPRAFATTWSTSAAAASIVEFTGGDTDLVYILRSYLAPLAEPWLHLDQRPRIILDIDEDDPPALRQHAELCRLDGRAGDAELMAADADKLERAVAKWIRTADLVLASSAIEIASLRARVGDFPARVLPNPMPARILGGWASPVDVLLVANYGYAPNIDAAHWLCHDVLPRLRHRMGREVRVALAGSYVGPPVAELEGGGVMVIRDPPSVTPLYEATTIAVAPIRASGGTRLKILEAFGHRRAVVSTTRGAEGLPVVADRHLLIADGAEDFADACGRALTDSGLRSRLVSAAVDIAIAHAWPRVASTVAEIATAQCTRRRPTDRLSTGSEDGTLPAPGGDWRGEWTTT